MQELNIGEVVTDGVVADSGGAVLQKKKRSVNRAKLQDNIWGWIFVILMVLGTTFFVYFSFIVTVILSFSNYSGGNIFEYLGEIKPFRDDALYWYKRMFVDETHSQYFWNTLGNSFFYLLGIPVGMVLSVALAVCMTRDIKGTNAFRVIYYVPTVASAVSLSLIWKRLFNNSGAINEIFGTQIQWLTSTDGVIKKITVLIMTVWKGLGGSIVLFVAGLNGVNVSYHEAADIDGANAWQIFWRITMPQLYPTIFYVLVTSVIGGMQIYIEPELIFGSFYASNTTPGGQSQTSPFVSYIFGEVNSAGNYAYASALGVILTIIIFLMTLVQFAWDSRRDK